MKIFIKKLIYFLLPVIIFGFFLELALRSIPNSYKYKNDFLQKESNTIETLILGNSHAYYGINPEYINQRSFNAANSAKSLKYDSKIFNKFFKKTTGDNLKNVIITVSYFSLFYDIESSKNRNLLKNYKIYYNLIDNFKDNFKLELFTYDLYSNTRRIFYYYIKKQAITMCQNNGWLRIDKKENLKSSGIANAHRHDDYIKNGDDIFNKNLDYIYNIISICEQKNINVILLTPPTHRFYRDKLQYKKWEMNLNAINNLVSKHNNCSYLNLLANDTFDDNDFYNADHLNSKGAQKLSAIINNKLIR